MPESPQEKIRPAPEPPPERFAPDVTRYAELDVTTNFSFLHGASHPDELMLQAAQLGYHAIAVTDINTLAGIVRMYDAAKQIAKSSWAPRLIIGARLVFTDAPDILVWAPNRQAYAKLCRLLTLGRRRAEKGECTLSIHDFLEHNESLLAGLVPTIPFVKTANVMRDVCDALGERLSLVVSRVYGPDDASRMRNIVRLGKQFNIPLLASNAVHYHDPARRPLQDVLTCIRHGCSVHDAGFKLFANGERYLKSPQQMHRLFADLPHAIDRGLEIAERCTFSLDELRYEYPDEIVPQGKSTNEYLAELTHAGALSRYPQGVPEKVQKLIEKELAFIGQLGWEAYFLTVYDLVIFARSRGILCQGRGSAANSAVCYCLGVTSVDPDKIDVLFERFISAARNEPPDIDIDFEHERREEVIQYVYEKYGRERAGMTATVVTYRGRSAVRDVGKALGLGLDVVEQLASRLDWWHRGVLSNAQLRESGIDPNDPTVRGMIELTSQLLGFPRHLSQHTGGLVMTRGALCDMVPIENASMEDRTVIQWDKDDIDTVGILKVDVLALGMLTVISKAFNFLEAMHTDEMEINSGRSASSRVRSEAACEDRGIEWGKEVGSGVREPEGERRGEKTWGLMVSPLASFPRIRIKDTSKNFDERKFEIHKLPHEDPATYDMMCDADTIGVFQVESRAQMSMLPRLRPREFYDIVIQVAIVRPGPIQGNMVHPYLRRRAGEEKVTYPSKDLEETLKNTLGVPLFQEQAMRVVMVAAGFSAEEADKLRRAMAAWRKNGAIDEFYPKIIKGMLDRGYSRAFAEQTFEQIQGFGEYGFPESHAASFAILVYASAWIKRHHPAVFCAALLNSQPMGFYAPAQIVRDARDHGVEVRCVDVNESEWDCTLESSPSAACGLARDSVKTAKPQAARKEMWGRNGPAVRLGFRRIKGLQEAHAERIVDTRKQLRRFESVEEFHRATLIPVSVIKRLAEADAFTSLGLSRRQALWQALELRDDLLPLVSMRSSPPPHLPKMPLGQEVMIDYSTGGLSLKAHPVSLVREELTQRGIITAEELRQKKQGWVKVAGLVLIRQRPGTASGIVFETIEDETGIVNLIVRPNIYERYRPAARHAGLLECHGYVERQGDVIHVMALKLFDLSHLLAGYRLESRDFH